MRKHQVIVVGGGVGGSSAAFHCKKLGLDVLMVEKDQFPRDKPCGDGIIPSVYPILKEMGVYDFVKENAWHCKYTRFIADNGEYIRNSNVETTGEPMYCMRRYIFDNAVNQAAQKSGIEYLDNFEVLEVIMERGQAKGVRGIYNGKVTELYSDLVILAAGSHCMAARKLGFYDENPDNVYYGLRGYFDDIEDFEDVEFYYPENFLPSGYIWFFPTGPKSANVGVFISERSLQASGRTSEELLWDWVENTEAGKKRLGNAKLVGKLKGWRLPCGMKKPIIAGGVMAVGDSGNMIEQFGGGGIPQAMVAGSIAAKTALKAVTENDFSMSMMENYAKDIQEALGGTYQGNDFLQKICFTTVENMLNMIHFCQEREGATMLDYMMEVVKQMNPESADFKMINGGGDLQIESHGVY